MDSVPAIFVDSLKVAHPSWHACLRQGLAAMSEKTPDYLADLASDVFLPARGRIFSAFSQPMDKVKYILVGEGPYPREESATGFCFMDGAVGDLWSSKGLSKPVNRATSLRNFIKMLLVTEGALLAIDTRAPAVAHTVSQMREGEWIQSLDELQINFLEQGFLLLNATLVFRENVAPLVDAKAWLPLLDAVFNALVVQSQQMGEKLPTMILWGRIAKQLESLTLFRQFPQVTSEHPYNLSFIQHAQMQAFFKPMRLLMPASNHQ